MLMVVVEIMAMTVSGAFAANGGDGGGVHDCGGEGGNVGCC